MRIDVEKFDTFEIVVDGNVYKVDIRKECGVDEANLSDDFVKHPSSYAWFSSVLALYDSKVERLKFQVEVLEAQLDVSIRERAVKDGAKLVERQVEGEIKRDRRWQTLMEEFLDAKLVSRKLGALVRALDVKKDCLIQLGARSRAELNMGRMGA